MEKDFFLPHNLDFFLKTVNSRNTMPSTKYTQQKGLAGLPFKDNVVIRQGQQDAWPPREFERRVGVLLALPRGHVRV